MLFGANRAVIDASVVESRVSLPRFLALKWRVDVTISNTLLQRALTPTILCAAEKREIKPIRNFDRKVPRAPL